jgi:hypothetical protein
VSAQPRSDAGYTNTPKALANFSPELERSDNSEFGPSNVHTNPERVRRERNPFRVDRCLYSGLKLANAFGVFVLKFQTDALLDAALA